MVKRKSLKKRTKKMMRNKKTRRINRQKGGNMDDLKRVILNLDAIGNNVPAAVVDTPRYKVLYACGIVEIMTPDFDGTRRLEYQERRQKREAFSNVMRELRDEYGLDYDDVEDMGDFLFNDGLYRNFNKLKLDATNIYAAYDNTVPRVEPVMKKRTRSNTVITPYQEEFAQLGPPRKRTSGISLNTTVASESTIKLSDGKEYNINDIRDMWRFSKTHTPLRHPYTEDDIEKIKAFIDFMKGGKAKRSRRTRKK
jgi:hypothetical protein